MTAALCALCCYWRPTVADLCECCAMEEESRFLRRYAIADVLLSRALGPDRTGPHPWRWPA